MRNVQMIRKEPGLISIPIEKAVYCENCKKVSNSTWNRCGLCGSDSNARRRPIDGGRKRSVVGVHPIRALLFQVGLVLPLERGPYKSLRVVTCFWQGSDTRKGD